RVRAEPPQVLDHPPARLELDRGQVVDVDAAVAGETRAEEEGDVVAPRRVRRLDVAELGGAALEQLAVLVLLLARKREPTIHVDARPRPHRVQAVVDVAAVDVGLERDAGARADVEVAARVDDDASENGTPSLLALEQDAGDASVLDERSRHPAVQK